jgi:hypothetical protein
VPQAFNDAFKNNPDDHLHPNIPAPISQAPLLKAKAFEISVRPDSGNLGQYLNTVKAYANAGLPFEHIANAGETLGDAVKRGEVAAQVKEGWQNKVGEVMEDESKILAWQNRGETISIVPQIGITGSLNGTEIVQTTQSLATQSQTQPVNVVEGISVSNQEQSALPTPTTNTPDLSTNPFLTAPANLK